MNINKTNPSLNIPVQENNIPVQENLNSSSKKTEKNTERIDLITKNFLEEINSLKSSDQKKLIQKHINKLKDKLTKLEITNNPEDKNQRNSIRSALILAVNKIIDKEIIKNKDNKEAAVSKLLTKTLPDSKIHVKEKKQTTPKASTTIIKNTTENETKKDKIINEILSSEEKSKNSIETGIKILNDLKINFKDKSSNKMILAYKNLIKKNEKITKKLAKAKGNVNKLVRVLKSPEFIDFYLSLKEISVGSENFNTKLSNFFKKNKKIETLVKKSSAEFVNNSSTKLVKNSSDKSESNKNPSVESNPTKKKPGPDMATLLSFAYQRFPRYELLLKELKENLEIPSEKKQVSKLVDFFNNKNIILNKEMKLNEDVKKTVSNKNFFGKNRLKDNLKSCGNMIKKIYKSDKTLKIENLKENFKLLKKHVPVLLENLKNKEKISIMDSEKFKAYIGSEEFKKIKKAVEEITDELIKIKSSNSEGMNKHKDEITKNLAKIDENFSHVTSLFKSIDEIQKLKAQKITK